jgi:hypothetical protein
MDRGQVFKVRLDLRPKVSSKSRGRFYPKHKNIDLFFDIFFADQFISLSQCFPIFFKSRNLSKISNHLAEPKRSILYYLYHLQGTQQEVGGTSGFRGTQVEKHCLKHTHEPSHFFGGSLPKAHLCP